MKTHEEMIGAWKKDPAFKKEYDRLDEEFQLFDELVKARQQAGMTQAELAERMGTKTPAVARLEAGGGTFTLRINAPKICRRCRMQSADKARSETDRRINGPQLNCTRQIDRIMPLTSLPYRASFRFLNIGLQIRTDSEEMLRFFRDSYQRFRSSAPAEHEFLVRTDMNGSPWRCSFRSQSHEYGVLKTGRGFVFRRRDKDTDTEELTLFSNGRQEPISRTDALRNADAKYTPKDCGHLFSFAQTALLNTLAGLLSAHHLFHAAALTWRDSGLILAGISGQGKSSLSLALVKHGCKFLSDDIDCVCPVSRQLIPFPRRLNLRQSGLSVLRRLLSDKEIRFGPTDMEE